MDPMQPKNVWWRKSRKSTYFMEEIYQIESESIL